MTRPRIDRPGKRMNHARSFLLFACGGPLALGLAAACSDDPARGEFEPSPDASAPVPTANLPDAAAPTDAATPSEPFDGSAEPVVCAVTPCAVELVAGANHFCARLSDGSVQCWGDDTNGALGGGESTPALGDDGGAATGPVEVVELTNAVQLTAAGHSTCALLASGVARCWGSNAKGQLGLRTEEPFSDEAAHSTPADVVIAPLARIDLGLGSTCGVADAGDVHCWGDNSKGQLTRTEVASSSGPVLADLDGPRVVRTGASTETGYALLENGRLFTWGRTAARPSSIDVDPSPAMVPALANVNDFAVGPAHACAAENGELFCWGARDAPLCTGLPDAELEPRRAPVYGAGHVQQVSVSKNTTCVRLTSGEVQCCGKDDLGQLGIGDAGIRELALRPASGVAHAVHVATADEATCALLRDGVVTCWGGNAHGELGGATRDALAHSIPSKVVFR